jgi:hypothetical protein
VLGIDGQSLANAQFSMIREGSSTESRDGAVAESAAREQGGEGVTAFVEDGFTSPGENRVGASGVGRVRLQTTVAIGGPLFPSST